MLQTITSISCAIKANAIFNTSLYRGRKWFLLWVKAWASQMRRHITTEREMTRQKHC
jgi:hypothetical protein